MGQFQNYEIIQTRKPPYTFSIESGLLQRIITDIEGDRILHWRVMWNSLLEQNAPFIYFFYMVDLPEGKTVGIRRCAELNAISEAYLSRVFAIPQQENNVWSLPGVKSGYELARPAKEIAFGDIIEAAEGHSYFSVC